MGLFFFFILSAIKSEEWREWIFDYLLNAIYQLY